jgi:hypothetical protein
MLGADGVDSTGGCEKMALNKEVAKKSGFAVVSQQVV